MSIRILVLAASCFASVAPVHADEIGSFTASKTCPLYQSKRNSTNPGNLATVPGKTYPVVDVLPPQGKPTWVRVAVETEKEPRWVESSCGTVSFAEQTADSCHLSSLYDSHVFAISWQPGFCKDHSEKPECMKLRDELFASSHFTLHGLWPNRNSCGTEYDFCGNVKQDVPGHDFCKFPDEGLEPQVSKMLGRVMPSVKYGTCLDRHEWWKHGTCRDASSDKYFLLAMELLQQINASSFVESFIRPNKGKTVSRQQISAAFARAFGPDAAKKIKINCGKGNTLAEIQVNLPKDLSKDLGDLLNQAADATQGSCKPDRISIAQP